MPARGGAGCHPFLVVQVMSAHLTEFEPHIKNVEKKGR